MRFVPLAEVADIAMGTAPPGSSYNDAGDGIPMIAGAGDFGTDFPSPKKWTTEASRIASPGDLIVCVRATIGDLNWADKEYCLGRGVAGVRAKSGKADIRYLARVIEAKKDELSRLGSGSTFLALRRKEIEEFPIPLPPLDEQRRIAAVLDKADALRRQRQQSLQLTEMLLQSVFVEMFGTERSPRCPRVKLSDHLEFITTGGRGWAKYYSNEGAQFIRSLDVRMNEIDSSQMVCVSAPKNAEAERTRTREGDVLLTMTGSLIGRVAPVTAQHSGGYISQHVAILRANGFHPEFLSWALSTNEGQRQIQKHQTGQSKPGLNFEQVKRLLVPRPSIDDEKKFCDLIRRRRIILADQRASLVQCESLFAAIQQRAFRGDLDLSRLILASEMKMIDPVRSEKNTENFIFIAGLGGSGKSHLLKHAFIGRGERIPWSEDLFLNWTLNRIPEPPFSFAKIWSAVEQDFAEPDYETVKNKVFEHVAAGVLKQEFNEEQREIVFRPRT